MTSISIVTNGLNGVITCSCSDCNATDDNDFKILCENLKRGREELKRDHEERKRDLQASFDRQDALLAQSYESLIKMMKQRQPTAIAKVSVPPRLPSLNPSTSGISQEELGKAKKLADLSASPLIKNFINISINEKN